MTVIYGSEKMSVVLNIKPQLEVNESTSVDFVVSFFPHSFRVLAYPDTGISLELNVRKKQYQVSKCFVIGTIFESEALNVSV